MLVAIGKYILSIDLSKIQQAAPAGGFNVDKVAVCHMNDLIEGISKIGEHEEDVTDLAIPSFSSGHIASSSADGSVRNLTLALVFMAIVLLLSRIEGVECCNQCCAVSLHLYCAQCKEMV